MLKDFIFFGSVDHAHNINITEFRAAFSPVGVGHAVVTTDFASSFHFATLGDSPVKKSIETSYSLSGVGWFHVLEESRKTTDNLLIVENSSNFKEAFKRHSGNLGAVIPAIYDNFIWSEFFFESEENVSFFLGEIDNGGGHHFGWDIEFRSGF